MSWAVIPFAIFFGCGFAVYYYVDLISRRLQDRHDHDGAWAEVARRAIFLPIDAIAKFAWGSGHIALADDALSRSVHRLRWASAISVIAWLGCGVALFTVMRR
jgi:hypothetical protein